MLVLVQQQYRHLLQKVSDFSFVLFEMADTIAMTSIISAHPLFPIGPADKNKNTQHMRMCDW